jgi:hypothetical protein
LFVARYAYGSSGNFYYNAWNLHAASESPPDWSSPFLGEANAPDTGFLEPAFPAGEAHEGMAVCGQYLYVMNVNDAGNPVFYSFDLNSTSGTWLHRMPRALGVGGPEGLMIADPSSSSPKLVYARKIGTTGVKMYSVQ